MNVSSKNKFEVVCRVSPAVSNDELNNLFASGWENHESIDFRPILERSLAYICAYYSAQLIGFVNLAWDGGIHAFVLDTTVRAEFRRRGIGKKLIEEAVKTAKERASIEWIHVNFEPHLQSFYDECGFGNTNAGLINLLSKTAK